VGLFYLGLATENESSGQKHAFPGDRGKNKRDAAKAAQNMLKQYWTAKQEVKMQSLIGQETWSKSMAKLKHSEALV